MNGRGAGQGGGDRKKGLPRGKPFAPGQSGNPNGRPTMRWLTDYIKAVPPEEADKPVPRTRREIMAKALWSTAIDRKHKDHIRAQELLFAYLHGKPTDRVELSGPDEGPIEFDSTTSNVTSELNSEQKVLRMVSLLRKATAKKEPDPEGGTP